MEAGKRSLRKPHTHPFGLQRGSSSSHLGPAKLCFLFVQCLPPNILLKPHLSSDISRRVRRKGSCAGSRGGKVFSRGGQGHRKRTWAFPTSGYHTARDTSYLPHCSLVVRICPCTISNRSAIVTLCREPGPGTTESTA